MTTLQDIRDLVERARAAGFKVKERETVTRIRSRERGGPGLDIWPDCTATLGGLDGDGHAITRPATMAYLLGI